MNRHIQPRCPEGRRGFTAVELFAVIAILTILAGLILPAIFAVRRRARIVVAQTEIQTLETAWKQYYAEYQKWPSCASETNKCSVTGDLEALLSGVNVGDDNPKKLKFMEFRRLDAGGNPVNPWWSPDASGADCLYYAKFDTDHDGIIIKATDSLDQPDTDVAKQVIIWTRNPKVDIGKPGWMIRSWEP